MTTQAVATADALVLDGVGKRIGAVGITEDVTVRLPPGERRALIGPNGAGKSTLMHIAAGVLRPTTGRVLFHGTDVTHLPVHRRARRGLARTFQITNLLPAMTVGENLALAVQAGSARRFDPVRPWLRSRRVWQAVDDLIDRGDLGTVRDIPVGRLPYGQQRRLEIVVAVARPCSVILLDEPGAGLSTEETEELLELVFGLDPRLAVLFIDHDVDLAMRLAHRVSVLHLGRIVAEGTPDEVRCMSILEDIYLAGTPRGGGDRA